MPAPTPPRTRPSAPWLVFTCALIAAVAAAFYVPALRRAHGLWPAPLDDVYIHFGFARSAALGHPFTWLPENGYSSGGTSLTYPLLLAPGYLLGLRDDSLGVFAALLACAALFDLSRSLRALVVQRAPGWIAWCAPPLLLAVPLLDWSWFSGMETALLGAVIGRALVAAERAIVAPAPARPRAQLALGVWGALLVATRPELAPLALLLGVAVAHGAGSLGTLASLARATGPMALFLATQACANRALTGEWSAAGAVRKLLLTNPYTSGLDVAIEVIKNLAALRTQALESALGGAPFSLALPLLALAALLEPRTRRLALALALGAALALALVSLNATARFQNLRYAAPSLILLLVIALLGAAALARRGRAGAAAAISLLAIAILAPARWFPRQIEHFARASRNIAEQQIEVGLRLAALRPRPRRVFLGDAGAIPYFSGLPALDGLGLGGYHDLPFARASVHGVPAVLELVERMAPAERPDFMAIYPSWWPGLEGDFARRLGSVKIEDNVICGADEKVLYVADWSTLGLPGAVRPGAVDELDVADLVEERRHAYSLPAPKGGWAIGATLVDAAGARRWEGGRIIPEGRAESFTVASAVASGPALLALRTDGGDALELCVEQERAGEVVARVPLVVPTRAADVWSEVRAPLGQVRGGDVLRVVAVKGAWRSFHMWLLRSR